MALNTRKSVMSEQLSIAEIAQINSDDAAGNFLARQFERQSGSDFLDERQQDFALRKSPTPHISPGVRGAPAEPELTVSSTHQEGINDAGDTPANSCALSNSEPHLHDCRDLTATRLRKKYPREYDTWKNMKQRAKGHVDPQFEKFSDFLASVGTCNGGTLDRIDPSDPEYAPGKVRWADKRTQSANRRNVRLIQTPDGPKTVPELAKLQKVGQPAIHMRLKNGWSDLEIWAGKRSAQTRTPPSPPPTSTSIPSIVQDDKAPSIFLPKPDLKSVWEKATREAFPGEWHELSASGKKQLHDLLQRCSGGYLHNHAEQLLAHTIKNWRRFTENARDRDGAFGSIPTRPTMPFLLKYLGAAVNLYLFDNNLEFIGTRIQPKAPLPSKPSQKRSEPALAAPAPAKPYIESDEDEDSFVQAYNDQIDADEPAPAQPESPEARAAMWREIAAIVWDNDRVPARANSPEIDPAEWEETLAIMAGWGEDEADCAQPARESRHTCSVSPLRSQSFHSRFPLLGQRSD
jgi:hypothetical protein